MGFQDKYDEYKERQEAKNYFRRNNDLYLKSDQWVKVIVLGIVGAIVVGIVLGVIISLIHISSMLFYLVAGYVIGNIVTRVSGVNSQQMGILAGVLAVLSFIVVNMTLMYYPLMQLGLPFDISILFELFVSASKQLLIGDLFRTLMAIVGVAFAYQQAQ
ncbi:MAG: hypothetical protein RR428_09075 [Coprobacillus sp.]